MQACRPAGGASGLHVLLLVLLVLLVMQTPVLAQQATAPTIRLGAQAVGMLSRVDRTPGGGAESEAYLTQPMVMGHMLIPRWGVRLAATLNFEGITMPDGELAPGNAGEGFVDRRHPHTYLHEAMVSLEPRLGSVDASLSAGRGFAPFGTDDPMVRPFVRYPANHHWSQILERWTLIAAIRSGPVTVEAGLFNGNEPEGPGDAGGLDRFGDSRAARVTVRPRPDLELQGSYAWVESPEFREGFGLDQRKWNASARFEQTISPATSVYGMFEVAETYEYSDGRQAFVFTTVLAETAVRPGPWSVAIRYERTTRPEEERLLDLYRTPRPHADENIIGATRWNTVTAAVGRSFIEGWLAFDPFAEVSRSSVEEITGAIFDPIQFYGGTRIWSLSFGVRLRSGVQHQRMGRYGVALASEHEHGADNLNRMGQH